MKLEELRVYDLSMQLGEEIYDIVKKWDYFQKDTIGKQLVRSSDSIAANLSEGFGRYHYKETINFNYYSRGSLFETRTWLTKSYKRNLITEQQYKQLIDKMNSIGVKLNNYIKSIRKNTKTTK